MQNGLCAVCGKPPDERVFAVDHDHATGEIRGLVHRHCNLMLGYAREDPELLRAGILYLKSRNFSITT
jgi:hypothetical protein